MTREQYRVTSEQTANYNCFAHAAGCSDFLWYPFTPPDVYPVGVIWPPGASTGKGVESFMDAYARHGGYVECDDGSHEPGREKIAIYVDESGEASHAARQLEDGKWTSKLGDWEDIEHLNPQVVESDTNGVVVRYMSRPRASSLNSGM